MNEPIISPWLIYWAGRMDMIHHFCIVAGVLLTMGAGISITGIVSSRADCGSDYNGFGKAFLNFTKKLTCVALIVDVLAMAVPTKAAMPLVKYLRTHCTPMHVAIVDVAGVDLYAKDVNVPIEV